MLFIAYDDCFFRDKCEIIKTKKGGVLSIIRQMAAPLFSLCTNRYECICRKSIARSGYPVSEAKQQDRFEKERVHYIQ